MAITPTAHNQFRGKENHAHRNQTNTHRRSRAGGGRTLRVTALPRVHAGTGRADRRTTTSRWWTRHDAPRPTRARSTPRFSTSVFGSTGAGSRAVQRVDTALGVGATGDARLPLLDATGASPIFSGDFNGAESRLSRRLFLDALAGEDELNQLLGVTPSRRRRRGDPRRLAKPICRSPLPAGVTLADLTGGVSLGLRHGSDDHRQRGLHLGGWGLRGLAGQPARRTRATSAACGSSAHATWRQLQRPEQSQH